MLREKSAIITGANRGIGLATVKKFAENGAKIWACARKENVEFEIIIKEMSERYSTKIVPVYFDMGDNDAMKSAINGIVRETKNIDILVNNAGISVEKFFSMTSFDVLQKTMEINFEAQVRMTQLVTRNMVRKKDGRVINVASVAGIESELGGLAYGSSKAAVIFATKTMALELGPYGIRVNSVSPGFIDTDMWENRSEDIYNRVLSETPLGRQGTPEEVANVILFLASDMSSYITAQNIIVDGGRKLG